MNGFEIESDQMDEYYEYLGEQGIDLVGDNDEGPNNHQITKTEEEFDLNDLSVPPGVKINDPVRMYLKRNWSCRFTICRRRNSTCNAY